jgi:hypothetical protein
MAADAVPDAPGTAVATRITARRGRRGTTKSRRSAGRRPSTRLAARAIAAAAALATVGLVAGTILIWLGRGIETLPVSYGRTWAGAVGLVVSSLCYVFLGALLATRIPGNPIGWLFLLTGFVLGTMLPVNLLVAGTMERLRPAEPLLVLIAWARTTFATPTVLTVLIVAGFLFPTGRPVSTRWWAAIALALLSGALLATATALNPEGLVTYPTIPNPLMVPAGLASLVRVGLIVAVVGVLLAMFLALASLVVRYRRGPRLLRVQLRWILFAVVTTIAAAVPFLAFRYLMDVGESLGEISAMVAQLGSCSFPIAAAFAVTRYHLYDVDVLIDRTLVYVPLMGILAGLYTASITLFQRVFVATTGAQSDLALVLTALVLAAGFTPIRSAVEALVARRYRPRDVTEQANFTVAPAVTPAAPFAAPLEPNQAPAAAGLPPEWDPTTSTSPILLAAAPVVSYVPVDDAGIAACPFVRGGVPLARCLRCSRLSAVVTAPRPGLLCLAERSVAAPAFEHPV